MALNLPNPDTYAELPDEMFVPGADDGQAEELVRPSTTYWHDVWQRFRRDPLAILGLAVILLMALAAIILLRSLLTLLLHWEIDVEEKRQRENAEYLASRDAAESEE